MNKKKIVLIEDDTALSEALAQSLRDANFEIAQAFDGETGLRMVEEQKPDLILLDEILPKMEGLEVHKKLREHEALRNIPVIMLTNVEDPKKVSRALEQGLKDYLIKADWSVGDIVEKVKEKLGAREQTIKFVE